MIKFSARHCNSWCEGVSSCFLIRLDTILDKHISFTCRGFLHERKFGIKSFRQRPFSPENISCQIFPFGLDNILKQRVNVLVWHLKGIYAVRGFSTDAV